MYLWAAERRRGQTHRAVVDRILVLGTTHADISKWGLGALHLRVLEAITRRLADGAVDQGEFLARHAVRDREEDVKVLLVVSLRSLRRSASFSTQMTAETRHTALRFAPCSGATTPTKKVVRTEGGTAGTSINSRFRVINLPCPPYPAVRALFWRCTKRRRGGNRGCRQLQG